MHETDFNESSSFSESGSSIRDLIQKRSKSQIWEQGALHAYAMAIQSMVQSNMSMAKIAKTLDESEEDIEKLYNLPPNATSLN